MRRALGFRVLVGALAVCGVSSTGALAQASQTQKPATRAAPAARTQTVDFGEGDLINGDRASGQAELTTSTPKARFDSLIKVRSNFDDKLLSSVNEM